MFNPRDNESPDEFLERVRVEFAQTLGIQNNPAVAEGFNAGFQNSVNRQRMVMGPEQDGPKGFLLMYDTLNEVHKKALHAKTHEEANRFSLRNPDVAKKTNPADIRSRVLKL